MSYRYLQFEYRSDTTSPGAWSGLGLSDIHELLRKLDKYIHKLVCLNQTTRKMEQTIVFVVLSFLAPKFNCRGADLRKCTILKWIFKCSLVNIVCHLYLKRCYNPCSPKADWTALYKGGVGKWLVSPKVSWRTCTSDHIHCHVNVEEALYRHRSVKPWQDNSGLLLADGRFFFRKRHACTCMSVLDEDRFPNSTEVMELPSVS